MEEYIRNLEKEFSLINNGFKEEEKRATEDFKKNDEEFSKKLAYSAYKSTIYQVRMYGMFLFGYLSKDIEILDFMKDEVAKDDNWRVQEVLAKSFDQHCKLVGYENSVLTIDEWLKSDNPNTRRAVTEGLRIWTSREYFKDKPERAILRLSYLKDDESEYVRKSVGKELRSWNLDNKKVHQVYKLASKFIEI